MQDHELYTRIAGSITPWTVGEIKVESATQRLEVQVECNDAVPKQCPQCHSMLPVCDLGEEQTWRQPDDGLWQVFLKGRLPLIECPKHGIVRVSPPWADWYVRGPDNSILGPWSLQQLKRLLDAGRISQSTLLKRSTSKRWVITGTVGALVVRQDETLESQLSVYELAAVDWAIATGPDVPVSNEPPALDYIPTEGHGSAGRRRESDGYRSSHTTPQQDRQTPEPRVTGVIPPGQGAKAGNPNLDLVLKLLDDSDSDAAGVSRSSVKPAPSERPSAPRGPIKRPVTRAEASPTEWSIALDKAVEMEHTAKVVRIKPDDAEVQQVKVSPRRTPLVCRRGFQQGFHRLMLVYLINSCLVCCLVPAVCVTFFSRLLLLSTSVFIPFASGDVLREGQLVECGLSALSLLVLIAFPVWHLISNGGILWHYVPSALVGMIFGFGLSPDYLDEVCVALQWCEVAFGTATVGITLYTMSKVPAQSRMSLPMIAAVALTVLSALALGFVRVGPMLTVQADSIPPQFRGALPDASLYVFGLYGTLMFIPVAILLELYWYVDFSSRQFIIRTGVLLGIYLLAGIASLGSFVQSAASGFFDVPLALLPLACISALAASIPSSLLLVDPQLSVTDD
ncbi:MAG: hypothetical protein JSS49_05235 [Planctomycetes bacterium]|nr:hypothetical protein [Planctomycetota bacterium]